MSRQASNDSRPELVANRAAERVTVASEIDEFNVALPKMHGRLHRASGGGVDTVVRVRDHEVMQVGHIDVGYPMLGTVDIADSAAVLGIVLESHEGSRWDGVDLGRGHVAVYGPGEHHTATDAAGTKVGIVAIDVDALDEAADALGRRTTRIERDVLRPDLARDVTRTFERAAFGDDPSILLATVARALSTPEASIARYGPRRLRDELIVSRAINHVHHTGNWLPSSLTLCRAAGVSERRLQTAFRRMFDTTPARFFRQRALSLARERLTDADGLAAPVTEIATGLGFRHLSRFSRYYLEQFGELPSATVRGAGVGN